MTNDVGLYFRQIRSKWNSSAKNIPLLLFGIYLGFPEKAGQPPWVNSLSQCIPLSGEDRPPSPPCLDLTPSLGEDETGEELGSLVSSFSGHPPVHWAEILLSSAQAARARDTPSRIKVLASRRVPSLTAFVSSRERDDLPRIRNCGMRLWITLLSCPPKSLSSEVISGF